MTVNGEVKPTILCVPEKNASLEDYSRKSPATLYTT